MRQMGRIGGIMLCLGALVALLPVFGQAPAVFNERTVAPSLNVQDREDIWVLHLRYKEPRVITVDVPGRGRKIVWYMWYQVFNRTKEPRYFIPDFELKTNDLQTLHQDEVLPAVQEAIRRIEAPTLAADDFKNSVTITEKPIPPTPEDSAPRAITGVAIWPDVYDRAKDTTHFSVFISGLSNGWAIDENKVIRRKTLQINFKRPSDGRHYDGRDIFVADVEKWLYRATSVKAPPKPGEAPAEPKAEPKAEN
jgi:hypothetical protein